MKTKCVAYYRTSSLTNVSESKDSKKRQSRVCKQYAKNNRLEISDEFYDAGVAGSLNIFERGAFASMIEYCEANNISKIVFEKADRFSRDLMVQEFGYLQLQKKGFEIISASGDAKFEDDINAALLRQMIGAITEYDRKNVVARLKSGRSSKALENKKEGIKTLKGKGKCEGRKSYQETDSELIQHAKKLRRTKKFGKKLSYMKISDKLSEMGYKTKKGNMFSASQVKRLVSGTQ